VEPRVAQRRQDERVRVAPKGERPGGHGTDRNRRSFGMTVTVGYAA
jgi:hypothetical protein